MTAILLAAGPEHAAKIYQGTKLVEWRRRMGASLAASLSTVVVYETAPVSGVTGYFSVENVIQSQSPAKLWSMAKARVPDWDDYGHGPGVPYREFMEYMSGSANGRAQCPTGIMIGQACRFPFAWMVDAAPRSYTILTDQASAEYQAQRFPRCTQFTGRGGDGGRKVWGARETYRKAHLWFQLGQERFHFEAEGLNAEVRQLARLLNAINEVEDRRE